MNCFSSGRDVSSRCKSVPRSSVTKYLPQDSSRNLPIDSRGNSQIFEGRNEDIAEADNLGTMRLVGQKIER